MSQYPTELTDQLASILEDAVALSDKIFSEEGKARTADAQLIYDRAQIAIKQYYAVMEGDEFQGVQQPNLSDYF